MLQNVLKKVFGTQNERDLKRLQPQVAAINEQESKVRSLTDNELRGRTDALRQRSDQGEALEVSVAGRLLSVRGHGKSVFAHLEDRSGQIQIYFKC